MWGDGTSRVINVMDFVMVSYDGTDHIGAFNSFTINESATMPYRIPYNFEFIVAGVRGDSFDGHLRKANNDSSGSVQVSIQGDDMELTKTVRMDEKSLNKYFHLSSIAGRQRSASLASPAYHEYPSYSLANPTIDITDNTFNTGLVFVARAEGGYVNNPNDPGGATNLGITQTTYDNYRKSLGLPPKDVKDITLEETQSIYYTNYWSSTGAGELPPKLAVVYFDACVNTGPQQATKDLQRALGIPADGSIGPTTFGAAQTADTVTATRSYIETRRVFYTNLASNKPELQEFLPGWLKRLDNLTVYVDNMPA